MKILFLGGTQFVGRHMVEAALARGHEVTLFNRGVTNPGLFPQVELLRGDRDGHMDALEGRRWDAAVDVNGYVPRLVRDSAVLLKGSVGQYIFVSTGSVYDFSAMKPFSDETSPLVHIEDESTEDWNGPAYGGLKVLCENVVQDIYPDSSAILRLGVVAGPYDPTDRVTYWVTRAAQGGEMLTPGGPERRIQFIDARDLANFTMIVIERQLRGIFNTLGNSVSWQHFLDASKDAIQSDARYTWVDDMSFLQKNVNLRARDFGTIPMLVPAEYEAIMTARSTRALDAGMVFRSCLNTARDVLAWDKTRPADEARMAGLSASQEADLLLKWHQQQTQ
jgi:2'-hydroxyisoflavone reductase